MYDKAVNTHPTTIKFVFEWYEYQEMCYRAVLECFFFDCNPHQYKTQ